MSPVSSPRRGNGFTLIELLVVVAIIAVLIGIAVPAYMSARNTAKTVAQQAQLTAIAQACRAYQQTFGEYPGYYSAAELATNGFSSNENLVLSLLGGIAADGTFDATLIGSGPTTQSGRTYDAFYAPKAGELVDITEGPIDNDIPELVDVSTGMPILYFRKLPGATYPVGANYNDGGVYSIDTNGMYINTPIAVDGNPYDNPSFSLLAGSNGDVLAWFAINPKLSDLSNGHNTNDDVVKGDFMLMSAGIDGIYVNMEQDATIGSIDDLNQFDDIVVHGGN